MKLKSLLIALAGLVILGGTAVLLTKRSNRAGEAGPGSDTALAATAPSPVAAGASEAANPKSSSSLKVIAYYFHVTVRCITCRTIESYSKEAIDRGFPEELKKGVIEWRPVNVQLLENRHFIQDYRLFTRSLVLVKVKEGKQVEWRNLEKVWALVGDKEAFLRYVRANVTNYLGDN
jgi:hypothetical protein